MHLFPHSEGISVAWDLLHFAKRSSLDAPFPFPLLFSRAKFIVGSILLPPRDFFFDSTHCLGYVLFLYITMLDFINA